MASNGELIAVWMDQSIGEKGAFMKLKERFQTVSKAISEWIYVDNDDDLLARITEKPHDIIVLIISGSSAKRVLGSISSRENIHSIYLFCGRKDKYVDMLRKDETKLRGLFDNEDELYDALKKNFNREFPS